MAEVIAFTPTRKVITFQSEEQALSILRKEYHNRIIRNAQELEARHDLEMLQRMFLVSLRLDLHNVNVRRWMAIDNKEKISQILWPMLLMRGHQTKDKAFKRKIPASTNHSIPSYWSDYIPGMDTTRDISYVKLPKQAMVIVDMIIDRIMPNAEVGVPEFLIYRYIMELAETGVLKTKQPPWNIFKYYLRRLETEGFIYIIKPGEGIKDE